jgi:hypothetical protein
MPTFKVTLEITDGLTLGHVLMTKGVDLLHIVETDRSELHHDKRDRIVEQIKLLTTHKTKTQGHFQHPSGKPIKEFVVDFLKESLNNTARWADMNKHIHGMGFGKSSLNNSLKFLVEGKIIKREKNGVYRLIR